MPRIESTPPVRGETQAIIRMVEDFPAPFGPRKPKDSPLATSMSMPATASTSAPFFTGKLLRRPLATIIGGCGPIDGGWGSPADPADAWGLPAHPPGPLWELTPRNGTP